jgi:nucleotide-binding universal stress UspA family protein
VDLSEDAKRYLLVPVDFSPASEAALLLAHEMAGCFDAVPLVLHVVHDPGDMPGYYAKSLKKKHFQRIEDSAEEMLKEFLQTVEKHHREGGLNADSLLVRGLPTTRILEVAAKHKVLMIVMGSKGHTGLKHLLLGSVAEHVVQLSPVPVMVVKSSKHSRLRG